MAYSTTTLAVLRGRVRERLLPTFWADAELNAYIVEALRVWNVLTGYFQNRTANIAINGSTDGHTLAADVATDALFITQIVDSTTNMAWETSKLDEVADMVPVWLAQTTPAPRRWIPLGTSSFYVHPIATTNNIKVDYIAKATVPTADGDYIQVGEEDLPALIDYVVFIAHLKEGGAELQSCAPLFQNFMRQAVKYNAKIGQIIIFNKFVATSQKNSRPDKS